MEATIAWSALQLFTLVILWIVIVWLINTVVPMDADVKRIVNVVLAVVLIILVLLFATRTMSIG